MVRNCQLSDLIYLTALRVCVHTQACMWQWQVPFFFPPCPLLSFVKKCFWQSWSILVVRGRGAMRNLGGFKMDISMRRSWPGLAPLTLRRACTHTNMLNCLCNIFRPHLAAVAALLSFCWLQVAQTSRSRLQPWQSLLQLLNCWQIRLACWSKIERFDILVKKIHIYIYIF